MSPRAEDLAWQAYHAFEARDLESFLDLLDPDVEVVPILGSELAGTVYQGHDGIRDWWDNYFAVFRNPGVIVEEIRDLGDRAIAVMRFRGDADTGEASPDLRVWTVTEFRDDKIVAWRTYRSEAEALEGSSG
jgi:ketosteroid isomerase-like protein